jgi:putative transposase
VAATADNGTVILIEWLRRVVVGLPCRVTAAAREASRPAPVLLGLAADAFRSRTELLAENALLRQQLIVVARAVERPKLRARERGLIVLLAGLALQWRNVLLLVRPETVLRWHRHGFRLFWRWKSSRRRPPEPRVPLETVELIRTMARDNVLWGAERIRGELLKVGVRVS